MNSESGYDKSRIHFFIFIFISVIVWLSRLLFTDSPHGRSWGINHLHFLPDEFIWIFLAAGLCSIALFFEPMRSTASRLFHEAGYIMDDGRHKWWLVISLLSLLFFWLLRMPTNLLGDGYTVINNIGGNPPVIFKWSEVGAIKVVHFVSGLLPFEGTELGVYAYAIVSVLSGGVAVFFFLGIAYESAEDRQHRLLIFCLLIFSGWMLLFFGYAENYPILWPFVTAYIYFSLRHIKLKNNLLIPTLLLLVALVLHLQILFFLISYLSLIIARGWGQRMYGQFRMIFKAIIVIMGLALLVLFVFKYQSALEFRIHFLPLVTGRPATPDYALISLTHILDILNEMILLIPLWPLLIFLGWRRLCKSGRDPINRFLLYFSLGGGILLFILDPRLGMGRDWDLFALAGLAPMIMLVRNTHKLNLPSPSYAGISCLALVLMFPFFAVNLSYQPSIEYMKSMLRLDQSRSKSGMIVLRNYYQDIGFQSVADSLNRKTMEYFPEISLSKRVNSLAENGRLKEAQAIANSIYRADPYSIEAYNTLGMVLFYKGDFGGALEYFEQSIRLRPNDHMALSNLALAYQGIGKLDEMMNCFRRAQKYAPESTHVLLGLSMGFYNRKQYDSAFVYGRKLLNIGNVSKEVYLTIGASAFWMGKKAEAVTYLTRYLEMNPQNVSSIKVTQNMLEKLQSPERINGED